MDTVGAKTGNVSRVKESHVCLDLTEPSCFFFFSLAIVGWVHRKHKPLRCFGISIVLCTDLWSSCRNPSIHRSCVTLINIWPYPQVLKITVLMKSWWCIQFSLCNHHDVMPVMSSKLWMPSPPCFRGVETCGELPASLRTTVNVASPYPSRCLGFFQL